MEGVGRGRGFLSFNMSPSVGRGSAKIPVTSTPMPKLEGFDDRLPMDTPKDVYERVLPNTGSGEVSMDFIADIVQQIGHSIGENIASCLESKAIVGHVGDNVMGSV